MELIINEDLYNKLLNLMSERPELARSMAKEWLDRLDLAVLANYLIAPEVVLSLLTERIQKNPQKTVEQLTELAKEGKAKAPVQAKPESKPVEAEPAKPAAPKKSKGSKKSKKQKVAAKPAPVTKPAAPVAAEPPVAPKAPTVIEPAVVEPAVVQPVATEAAASPFVETAGVEASAIAPVLPADGVEAVSGEAGSMPEAVSGDAGAMSETAQPAAPSAPAGEAPADAPAVEASAPEEPSLPIEVLVQQVLDFLKQNPWARRSIIVEVVPLNNETVYRRVMGMLVESGQVITQGNRRSKVYALAGTPVA